MVRIYGIFGNEKAFLLICTEDYLRKIVDKKRLFYRKNSPYRLCHLVHMGIVRCWNGNVGNYGNYGNIGSCSYGGFSDVTIKKDALKGLTNEKDYKFCG